jgi:four helix bundle protein
MTVNRFEDLIAWQKARALARTIYAATRQKAFANDYALVRQIQRAAISIMANIAEGFERHNPTEFHQFLSTARASCAEVRSHLYIAVDIGYLSQNQFAELQRTTEEVSRIICGLQTYIRSRRPTNVNRNRSLKPATMAPKTQNSELRT